MIAAARRGARALGVEYNPKMVELSRQLAAKAGVADKARFVEGDMFESDISRASVLALFLLPSNLIELRPKFLALKPGTRIVSNTFSIAEWEPDETVRLSECSAWCTALLWIVPANAAGAWRTPQGTLTLTQRYQMVSGTLGPQEIANGRLRGEELRFTAGAAEYVARLDGDRITGTMRQGGNETAWRATRTK